MNEINLESVMTTEQNKKPLVLLVDDVAKNIQLLSNILSRRNYQIAFATNGSQALNMVAQIQPDIILLDIMMPGMDGFEVCRKLKEEDSTKQIPIIFLTGKTDTSDITTGFQCGAIDYITKPFNTEELLARVDTHLELKRVRDEMEGLISYLHDTKELFNKIYDSITLCPQCNTLSIDFFEEESFKELILKNKDKLKTVKCDKCK